MNMHVTDTGALLAPPDAIGAIKVARTALRSAIFRLDERNLECPALAVVSREIDEIAAVWQGRPLGDPTLPDYVTEGMKAWRRAHRRSY